MTNSTPTASEKLASAEELEARPGARGPGPGGRVGPRGLCSAGGRAGQGRHTPVPVAHLPAGRAAG